VSDWLGRDFSKLGASFAVWPRSPVTLGDRGSRADFFDSVHHSCAVVGINTTAMVESAIVGRPVLSLVTPKFSRGQEGTLHFRQISAETGGIVRVARSIEEHAAQLAEAVDPSADGAAELRAFAERFVRPHGLDRPVAPLVVAAIDSAVGG
jgi:hypothetical protein